MFAKIAIVTVTIGLFAVPRADAVGGATSGIHWFLTLLRATFEARESHDFVDPQPGQNRQKDQHARPTESEEQVEEMPPTSELRETPLATDVEKSQALLKDILQRRCGACHIGQEREIEKLDMSDFDALEQKGYLVPGDPARSTMWERVSKRDMPPPSWTLLALEERQQIRKLILKMKPELPSIIETGEGDPRLTKFVEWARRNKLIEELLHSDVPFTILAPTNEAIERVGSANLKYLEDEENAIALRTTLLNHGIAGSSIALANMVRKGSVETIQSPYVVIKTEDAVWIDHAKVVEADIKCSNGVIHIIDRVLVPSSVSSKFPELPVTELLAGIQMAILPGGRFQMGSPITEKGRRDDEGPQHPVQLSPFMIGTHEITRKQYVAIMHMDPSDTNMPGRRELPNEDPAQQISWFDAVRFCNELSHKYAVEPYYHLKEAKRPDGTESIQVTIPEQFVSGFRLPTEGEWEFACRAGGKGAYCFGDAEDTLREYGWFYDGLRNETHSVCSLNPNAFGLYDMHGNVAEWCQDWYARYPAAAQTDPTGPRTGEYRVLRGGSYIYGASALRSAARHKRSPGYRHRSIGFRVARYLPAERHPGRTQFVEPDE